MLPEHCFHHETLPTARHQALVSRVRPHAVVQQGFRYHVAPYTEFESGNPEIEILASRNRPGFVEASDVYPHLPPKHARRVRGTVYQHSWEAAFWCPRITRFSKSSYPCRNKPQLRIRVEPRSCPC